MKEILCPLCQKYVGKCIPDGNHDSGGLGKVMMYKSKYDYRIASHVFWHEKNKCGVLCRKCAKAKFPSGEYWTVYHLSYGSWGRCGGGDSGDPWLYTMEEKAQARCDELSARFGPNYKIERHTI